MVGELFELKLSKILLKCLSELKIQPHFTGTLLLKTYIFASMFSLSCLFNPSNRNCGNIFA